MQAEKSYKLREVLQISVAGDAKCVAISVVNGVPVSYFLDGLTVEAAVTVLDQLKAVLLGKSNV